MPKQKIEPYQLRQYKDYSKITYKAMASSCEILIRDLNASFCHQLARIAYQETSRIESKFSRYIKGNLVDQMNHSNGQRVKIDQETFRLLEYARNLFELSDGAFDITSGILRKLWAFTPGSVPPTSSEVQLAIKQIGFTLIQYDQRNFSMPKGMQVDFGGIGKEYAVDQVTDELYQLCQSKKSNFLINFGGDLSAKKFSNDMPPWVVGLETANNNEIDPSVIQITEGAVATSGHTKKYFEYQGRRYGHLLNPKTGYPIEGAPLSVTVFASSCVLAGSFSSLSMLQGSKAETFLKNQGLKYRCIW